MAYGDIFISDTYRVEFFNGIFCLIIHDKQTILRIRSENKREQSKKWGYENKTLKIPTWQWQWTYLLVLDIWVFV